MAERRIEADVIGPGSAGYLRVRLGDRVRDVPVGRIPCELRMPNSKFVAVCAGGEFVGVEEKGEAWLNIQRAVRKVLCGAWDPIGVADAAPDEYDSYIADIYSLLRREAPVEDVAAYLGAIESERMGLRRSPEKQRLAVAAQLRSLALPSV